MKPHECEPDWKCTCEEEESLGPGWEDASSCPYHGNFEGATPRCRICGRFMSWEKERRIADVAESLDGPQSMINPEWEKAQFQAKFALSDNSFTTMPIKVYKRKP